MRNENKNEKENGNESWIEVLLVLILLFIIFGGIPAGVLFLLTSWLGNGWLSFFLFFWFFCLYVVLILGGILFVPEDNPVVEHENNKVHEVSIWYCEECEGWFEDEYALKSEMDPIRYCPECQKDNTLEWLEYSEEPERVKQIKEEKEWLGF